MQQISEIFLEVKIFVVKGHYVLFLQALTAKKAFDYFKVIFKTQCIVFVDILNSFS